jgi:hypothetical protein
MQPYDEFLVRTAQLRHGSVWRTRVTIGGRAGPERTQTANRAVLRIEAPRGQLVRVDVSDVGADGGVLVTYTRALVLDGTPPQNTMDATLIIESLRPGGPAPA